MAYLAICFAMLLNAGLHHKGLPSLSLSGATSRSPLGGTGPAITGALGLLMLGIALLAGGLGRVQWLLIALVSAWLLAPWLSLGVSRGVWSTTLWGVGATGLGVAVAAGLAGTVAVRWTLYVAGVIWSAGSLVVAGLALRSADPSPVLVLDPFDRFTNWLRLLGLEAADGSSRALVGVGLHRNLLGMALALFLVVQLRHVIALRRGTPERVALIVLGPVLTAIPLLWSMSRTSIAAAGVGLIAGLLPVERLRRPCAMALVSAAPLLIILAPLIAHDALAGALEPGTMRWRALLWQEELDRPGVWTPLGSNPIEPVARDAVHAHNQVLETLIRGGILAALALAAAVVIGTWVGLRAAGRDGRATFSVITTASVIAGSEVVGSAPTWTVLNTAAVITIAVITSAAGLLGDDQSGSGAADAVAGPHDLQTVAAPEGDRG